MCTDKPAETKLTNSYYWGSEPQIHDTECAPSCNILHEHVDREIIVVRKFLQMTTALLFNILVMLPLNVQLTKWSLIVHEQSTPRGCLQVRRLSTSLTPMKHGKDDVQHSWHLIWCSRPSIWSFLTLVRSQSFRQMMRKSHILCCFSHTELQTSPAIALFLFSLTRPIHLTRRAA